MKRSASNTKTRPCPACGGDMERTTRKRTIRYQERSKEIAQPAWWCGKCGEGVLESRDSVVADRAFATLKARAEGVLDPAAIARVRARLKLTQRRAGKILGGGARAFQRYESGAVVVSLPMSNLLRLLDERPELLSSLMPPSADTTQRRAMD